jgi:hypothetical protein
MHCNIGLLAARHWTRIQIEHTKQMSAKPRHADIYIKDKIEKLKVEYRRQKTLPKEQTGGSVSTWVWFKHIKHIMGGTAKGDGLVRGCD